MVGSMAAEAALAALAMLVQVGSMAAEAVQVLEPLGMGGSMAETEVTMGLTAKMGRFLSIRWQDCSHLYCP